MSDLAYKVSGGNSLENVQKRYNLYRKMLELRYGTNFQRIILLYQRPQDQMIYLLGVFWVAKVNYNE